MNQCNRAIVAHFNFAAVEAVHRSRKASPVLQNDGAFFFLEPVVNHIKHRFGKNVIHAFLFFLFNDVHEPNLGHLGVVNPFAEFK